MTEALELCGAWSTEPDAPGEGICPRGPPMRFHATLTLARVAGTDPWFELALHAIDADSGRTLHAEHGILRGAHGKVELSLVMSSGRMEFARGTLARDGGLSRLVTTSEAFLNDRLQVIATRRTLAFDRVAGACDLQLELATGLGWPELTHHLGARLLRR